MMKITSSLHAAIVLVKTKFILYPEEKVERENIEVSLVLNVQKFENILKRCRLFPVFQSQYKVKIGLIVLEQLKRDNLKEKNHTWTH